MSSWYAKVKRDQPWLSPALLGDWIVVFLLGFLAHRIEATYPYQRDVAHFLGDVRISWPHSTEERVPVPLLFKLAFWLPLGVMVAISAARRSLHEIHHSILVVLASSAVMRITVEVIKNRVGSLRPDFLDRCQWEPIEQVCTGAAALVKDGRRSFPSGHSATAFQGLVVLSLFVAGKSGAFALTAAFPRSSFVQSRLLRFCLAVSPLFLAIWIAITRLEDHMHHVEDVLAGTTIGLLSGFSIYLIYFPNPFSRRELPVMGNARLVYGVEDEGGISLERSDSVEEV